MGAWQTEAVREKPPVTLPAETVWEGRPAGRPAIQPPLSMGPPAGPPESSAGLGETRKHLEEQEALGTFCSSEDWLRTSTVQGVRRPSYPLPPRLLRFLGLWRSPHFRPQFPHGCPWPGMLPLSGEGVQALPIWAEEPRQRACMPARSGRPSLLQFHS